MLAVYRWFTAVLFAFVVLQVALIGYAVFHLGHELDKEGSVTKSGVEGPGFAVPALGFLHPVNAL